MTRWTDWIRLKSPRSLIGPDGSARTEFDCCDAPCNVFTVGDAAWAAAAAAGLTMDAEVQLRALDYAGQTRAEFRGCEYDVDHATAAGEFVRLVLRRRAANV